MLCGVGQYYLFMALGDSDSDAGANSALKIFGRAKFAAGNICSVVFRPPSHLSLSLPSLLRSSSSSSNTSYAHGPILPDQLNDTSLHCVDPSQPLAMVKKVTGRLFNMWVYK